MKDCESNTLQSNQWSQEYSVTSTKVPLEVIPPTRVALGNTSLCSLLGQWGRDKDQHMPHQWFPRLDLLAIFAKKEHMKGRDNLCHPCIYMWKQMTTLRISLGDTETQALLMVGLFIPVYKMGMSDHKKHPLCYYCLFSLRRGMGRWEPARGSGTRVTSKETVTDLAGFSC